jgi:hypothetical protein
MSCNLNFKTWTPGCARTPGFDEPHRKIFAMPSSDDHRARVDEPTNPKTQMIDKTKTALARLIQINSRQLELFPQFIAANKRMEGIAGKSAEERQRIQANCHGVISEMDQLQTEIRSLLQVLAPNMPMISNALVIADAVRSIVVQR